MIPASAAVTTRERLFGRDADITRLLEVADLATGHGAQMAVLTGEAGIGKTSLALETLAQLKGNGWSAHVGYCVELVDRSLPFGPLVSILRSVLLDNLDQIDEFIGHRRHDLVGLLPELGGGEAGPMATAGDVRRLFDSVASCLAVAAHVRPLALLIEDLHWSDAATRDLIASLVRGLGPAPVLLIVTKRTGFLARQHPLRTWLAEHRRMHTVHGLDLTGLTVKEIARLTESVLDAPVHPSLVASLVNRTRGNPYYCHELLAATEVSDAGLPPSLADFLGSRLDRLDAGEREVLRLLAVAGEPVSHRRLTAAMPDQPVEEFVRTLFDASILVLKRDGYAIAPALLGEAILCDVLPFEQDELRRRMASTQATVSAERAPRPATPEYPHFLTAREVEVMSLLAEGLTNKAIGELLFVSPRTVSTHVSNLLAKLAVATRGEAAAAYHRLGLAEVIDLRDPEWATRSG